NADKSFDIKVLIDSGAGGTFIDKKFALQNRLALTPLNRKINAYNADGTKNSAGSIEHCVWLKVQIGKTKVHTRFLVTGLGEDRIILGLPWLKEINLKVDWEKGTINIDSQRIRTSFTKVLKKAIEMTNMKIISPNPFTKEIFDETRHLPKNDSIPDNDPLIKDIKHINFPNMRDEETWLKTISSTFHDTDEEDIPIPAKMSISQELAHKIEDEKPKPKTILPEAYDDYHEVFEKKPSERMPERRRWDHAIDLKPDFIPKDSKIYPMSPEKQENFDEFLEENLRKDIS